jgi:hypothetical protein
MRAGHPEGVLSGPGEVGGMPVLDQPSPDEAGHLHIVFDHEDSHGSILIVIA